MTRKEKKTVIATLESLAKKKTDQETAAAASATEETTTETVATEQTASTTEPAAAAGEASATTANGEEAPVLPKKKRKSKKDAQPAAEEAAAGTAEATTTTTTPAAADSTHVPVHVGNGAHGLSNHEIEVLTEFASRSDCVDYYRRLYITKTLRVDKEHSGSRQILLKCDAQECSFHLNFYKSTKDQQWRLTGGSKNNFEHVSLDEATGQWSECSGMKKSTRRDLLMNEEIVDAMQREVSIPTLIELSTNLGLPCSYHVAQRARKLFKRNPYDEEGGATTSSALNVPEATPVVDESASSSTMDLLHTAVDNEVGEHSLKELKKKRAKNAAKKEQEQVKADEAS